MSDQSPVFARPTTRGELRDKLQAGIQCEVAAEYAEMTDIMLRGWLNFTAFTMRLSFNDGWIIFAPTSCWGPDGRCIHCDAGNDAHHNYTCPDKRVEAPK